MELSGNVSVVLPAHLGAALPLNFAFNVTIPLSDVDTFHGIGPAGINNHYGRTSPDSKAANEPHVDRVAGIQSAMMAWIQQVTNQHSLNGVAVELTQVATESASGSSLRRQADSELAMAQAPSLGPSGSHAAAAKFTDELIKPSQFNKERHPLPKETTASPTRHQSERNRTRDPGNGMPVTTSDFVDAKWHTYARPTLSTAQVPILPPPPTTPMASTLTKYVLPSGETSAPRRQRRERYPVPDFRSIDSAAHSYFHSTFTPTHPPPATILDSGAVDCVLVCPSTNNDDIVTYVP